MAGRLSPFRSRSYYLRRNTMTGPTDPKLEPVAPHGDFGEILQGKKMASQDHRPEAERLPLPANPAMPQRNEVRFRPGTSK
jgi:hypothetical protein